MDPSTRAVLYIGFQCNIKCKFCYYKDHSGWKNITRAKFQAWVFRYLFGDDRVDITGGEPTVYPHIEQLIKYCHKIGLRPTIITNGIALSGKNLTKKLKNAGIFDFLVSIHGLDEIYNETVDVKNAFSLQKKAIANLKTHDIPFRTNVTITKFNYKQLEDIARYCISIGARVVNFISFNPFSDWRKHTEIDFQEKHSIIAPHLGKALEILDKNNVEANVRYFPFCILKKFEKHQQNFLQLIYDTHEWDYASSMKRKNPWYFISFIFSKVILRKPHKILEKTIIKQGNIARRQHCVQKEKCSNCSMRYICDGLTEQYYQRFGEDELSPYDGDIIHSIDHYMKRQQSFID